MTYHLNEPVSPCAFQTRYLPTAHLQWLAVATDGWNSALLRQLAQPQPDFALQRWVNKQAKQRGNFDDDGAIALWWQEKQDENSLD